MEKYWNQYAISLAVSLVGCISYAVFAAIKNGLQNLQERDIAIVFLDFIAVCSAVKIVYLAFDVTICRPESKIDLAFLALGGLVIFVISTKSIASRFK
jgi:hypothetical protein